METELSARLIDRLLNKSKVNLQIHNTAIMQSENSYSEETNIITIPIHFK